MIFARLCHNSFSDGWHERQNAALLRADEQWKLQRERWRGTTGRSLARLGRKRRKIGKRNECNWTVFGLKRDDPAIKHRPSGTHPGTEQGTMRRSLMMGMMSSMLDGLRLCESTNGKDSKHQED